MLSASSDESRRSVPESVCSTGARRPARMASTITNGQKLVLMFRLPQIIFFRCGFWAETAASQKAAVPCQNSSWDEKWYGFSGREGPNTIIASTAHGDFGGQESVCACGPHIYYKDGRKVGPDQAARS